MFLTYFFMIAVLGGVEGESYLEILEGPLVTDVYHSWGRSFYDRYVFA